MKYRGHEKNQQFLSLNDSSFCLKKRKNHPRKRLFKTIKTNEKKEYQRERIKTTTTPLLLLLRIFVSSKKKKKRRRIKKERKNFCPNFVPEFCPSRNVAATGGRGSRSLPVTMSLSERTRGQGVYPFVCPFSRRVPAL